MTLLNRIAGMALRASLTAVLLVVLGVMLRSIGQEIEARRPQSPVFATATVWSLAGTTVGTVKPIDPLQAQATAEVIAVHATQAARYCTDPAKAVLRVSYHNQPNAYVKDLFDYLAQGSVENTCNYAVSIRLYFSSTGMPIPEYATHDHYLFVFARPLLPGEIREFNEVITWGSDPYAILTPFMAVID